MTSQTKTPHARIDIVDSMAKTPKALALGLARYSAAFYDGSAIMPPQRLIGMHLETLHTSLFDYADLEADIIPTDFFVPGLEMAWMSPEACVSLHALAALDDADYLDLAEHCKASDPALRSAEFCDLRGERTSELPQVLKTWSRAASQTLLAQWNGQEKITVFLDTIFSDDFLAGATTIDEIDNRIFDVAEMIGIHNPAALGTLMMRATELVDADTYTLGVKDPQEIIAGVPYALTLAWLAQRAGISHEEISLQNAYSGLAESNLRGHAEAIASGAALDGDLLDPEDPEFTVYHQDAIHRAGGALLGILTKDGGFAAVVAACDLLRDTDFTNKIEICDARRIAEIAFVSSTGHSEGTVREALCAHLTEVLPSIVPGEENPSADPVQASLIARRLTQALRRAFPDAAPISAAQRHEELVQRFEA